MKKLLLLLPLALVTSCSAGHDLMSDKPFRADCKAPEDQFSKEDLAKWEAEGHKNLIRFDVDPSLPQATVEASTAPVQTFDVVAVSPREIRLASQSLPGITVKFLWSIDRESGEIRSGMRSAPGVVTFEKYSLVCKYKSL